MDCGTLLPPEVKPSDDARYALRIQHAYKMAAKMGGGGKRKGDLLCWMDGWMNRWGYWDGKWKKGKKKKRKGKKKKR